jgi:probable addiction module antidote protein
MKRNSHDPRAVSHDQKVIERLRNDPLFASEYLKAAMEDEDEPRVLLIALRRIAEARGGITQIARKAGVERESLHRALSGRGNPRFSTLSAVAKAVGLRLTVEPV